MPSHTSQSRRRAARAHVPVARTRLTGLLLALLACAATLTFLTGSALADSSQVAMLEADNQMQSDAIGTVQQARDLGISVIRVAVRWDSIAPDANSFRAPKRFNASNPADYASSKWAPYDDMARDAASVGIRLDFDLSPPAPLWATGRGMPHQNGYPFHNWEPSGSGFGKFMRAVATRYSGKYNPSAKKLEPGNSGDLPRINFWSIWNEPNYGPSLAPQELPHHPGVPDSTRIYRSMVDQGYSALKATGHGSDTLLFGETAARGSYTYGVFNMMLPMVFYRGLYCLGGNYRPVRGTTARLMGCPTTAAGSRAFAKHNPALFKAAGVADHPYMRWFPPNDEANSYQPAHFRQIRSSYASLATIGNLTRGLNRALGAYHNRRKMPVWNTEFAYNTNPPAHPTAKYPYHYPSQSTAAYWDNWAEYIAWKNSRLASFDQYILRDPPPSKGQGFPSGLINSNGTPKPGLAAFRMPLYLPHTTASSRTKSLEVWGAVRPLHFVEMDQPGVPQHVNIQFEPKGSSTFATIAAHTITSPEGYFDTHMTFPSSGTVRLQWTYPSNSLLAMSGTTVYSRTQSVTVK